MNFSWTKYNQNANLSEFLVEQKVTSNKQKVKSNQQKVTRNQQKIKKTTNEQRPKTNGQKAKINEQRAKSFTLFKLEYIMGILIS